MFAARVQRCATPSTAMRASTRILRRFDHSDAQESLRQLIAARTACRSFASDPVPDDVLADVLRLTQRAPSGFNMQPYACVLVRQQADRERLAEAMLASNGRKVREAPVVAVFAADLEPSRRVPRIQKMMHDNGASAEAVNNLPHYTRLFSGEGELAGGIRSLISTVVSPIRAVPSHGFDETRVKHALDIPDRYAIPVVVCCGYPSAPRGAQAASSPRLHPTEVFFDGKFGGSTASLFGLEDE
ncbi:hypothetical protein ATCC90586_006228 [Pythium insidiosum]|nr:hypothetical protein ATCC90586_006228 [Pythium insidiosum]